MKHSKRTNCSDWDEEKDSSSQKHRRRSHSSERDYKRFNSLKTADSNCLDDRSIHERDHHDRRYVEEYRNDFSDVDDHRHYHRDYEKSHRHHYSKSSGRSRKSSHKRKHKKHGPSYSSHPMKLLLL